MSAPPAPVPLPSRRHWGGNAVALAIAAGVVIPLVTLGLFSAAHRYVFPQLLPAEWSWRAWRVVFDSGGGTWSALGWSLAVAVAVAAISLLVAVPAGRALGLHRFRGKRLVEFLIVAPLIVPTVAVAIGLDITFIRLGLAGTVPGVVLVHLIPAAPYAVLILAGVFANYDTGLESQARTLGAGRLAVLRFVTLPSILPGLIVAGFFAFVVSWSQYLLTLQVGAGKVVTLPVLLVSTAAGGDTAVISALTIVFAVPALLLLVFASRHLVRVTAGAEGLR